MDVVKIINKAHIETDISNKVKNLYKEFIESINQIKVPDLKEDYLNTVLIIALYISNSELKLDKQGITFMLLKDDPNELINKNLLNINEEDLNYQTYFPKVKEFIKLIAKYNLKTYEKTIEFLINVAMSQQIMSNQQFNCIKELLIDEDNEISYNEEWNEVISFDDFDIIDKIDFIEFSNEIFEENGKKYIYFGKYPQTVVLDDDLIAKLKTIKTVNEKGYIEYDGKEYAKLRKTENCFFEYFYEVIEIKDDTDYYFVVEPIKWIVLEENDGKYRLMSNAILDVFDYYDDFEKRTINRKIIRANNYEYSKVRAWLNGYDGTDYLVDDFSNDNFLMKAFSRIEQAQIVKERVLNGYETGGYYPCNYHCPDTFDKVFLFSVSDLVNRKYGFKQNQDDYDMKRAAVLTDYVKVMPFYDSDPDLETGKYMLRSPAFSDEDDIYNLTETGYFDFGIMEPLGIRPGIVISQNIKDVDLFDQNNTKIENGQIFEEGENKYIYFGKYPTTVVKEDAIIDKLNLIKQTNALGYLEYNNNEYLKAQAAVYESNSHFINGDKIIHKKTYYFKVEPIKWRVLEEKGKSCFVISEYILDNLNGIEDASIRTINGNKIYNNNYKYSNIRAWLNGYDASLYEYGDYTNKGFLNIAFTKDEIAKIENTLLDNSILFTGQSKGNRIVHRSEVGALCGACGFYSGTGLGIQNRQTNF